LEKSQQDTNVVNLSNFLFKTQIKMGKRSHKNEGIPGGKSNETGYVKNPMVVDDKAVDPSLALLFACSVRFYLPKQDELFRICSNLYFRPGQSKHPQNLDMKNRRHLKDNILRQALKRYLARRSRIPKAMMMN